MLQLKFYRTVCLISIIIIGAFAAKADYGVDGIQLMHREERFLKDTPHRDVIMKRLRWARKVIEKNGDKAFSIIGEKNKTWKVDNVVVFTSKGKLIDSSKKNFKSDYKYLSVKDIEIIKNKIFLKVKEGGGWLRIAVPKVGSHEKDWKAIAVETAESSNGDKYILICGNIDIGIDKEFIEDLLKSFVESHDYRTKGVPLKESLQYIDLFTHEYSIFLLDRKGVMLFNPAFPSLEGRNFYDFADCKGNKAFQKILKLAKDNNEGWIEFQWAKPMNHRSYRFRVFFRKVDWANAGLVVGAGYYPEIL